MDQPGKGASPTRGQLNRKNEYFPCPHSFLRIWSRETGSAVPSRVSLLISILRLNLVLIYGIPPEFRGGVHLFISNRHTPLGQSRVYRVTQLRTDGVHCRESAGTEPVNLKVVPNECCLGSALAGHHGGPINIRLSFPHPLIYAIEYCICYCTFFVVDSAHLLQEVRLKLQRNGTNTV